MAKVTLTDLTSLANDTSATNSINTNFQTIEDYINDNVLSRDTGAETNTMQNDLDMNNYDLNNVTNLNGEAIGDLISGATTAATAAAASAAAAAADAIDTAADAAATAQDAIDTAADAAATAQDAIDTAADLAATNAALASVDHIIEYVAASATSHTPDMSEYANFHFTVTGNFTINNPDDEIVGQSGVIIIIQGGSGGYTATWGTDYEFPGGTAPTLSTAVGAVDVVPYYVYASGRILCGNILASYS